MQCLISDIDIIWHNNIIWNTYVRNYVNNSIPRFLRNLTEAFTSNSSSDERHLYSCSTYPFVRSNADRCPYVKHFKTLQVHWNPFWLLSRLDLALPWGISSFPSSWSHTLCCMSYQANVPTWLTCFSTLVLVSPEILVNRCGAQFCYRARMV